MKISRIKTEEQYNTYLKRMHIILDAKEGTKEFEELDLLALVLEKYEEEQFPIPSKKYTDMMDNLLDRFDKDEI